MALIGAIDFRNTSRLDLQEMEFNELHVLFPIEQFESVNTGTHMIAYGTLNDGLIELWLLW